MNVDLIVDLQYGSTGKGLLAGYLANMGGHDAAVTCNMPNAGHTFIDAHGNKFVHKVLPNGLASPTCNTAFIGPGAVFDIDQMITELENLRAAGYEVTNVIIHEAACVLTPDHRKEEMENTLSSISSTRQGSSIAMIEKIRRNEQVDPRAFHYAEEIREVCHECDGVHGLVVNQTMYRRMITRCKRLLAEGCQGFSLGYNQGFWPYCTSRECTTYRMLSDMGIPWTDDLTVWGAARTYPIRVGSLEGTTSGGWYPDQIETNWESLGVDPETTTVTGRERRVFTFSVAQVVQAMEENGVDKLFMNFANYMSPMELGQLIDRLGYNPNLYGYGPTINDVREAI